MGFLQLLGNIDAPPLALVDILRRHVRSNRLNYGRKPIMKGFCSQFGLLPGPTQTDLHFMPPVVSGAILCATCGCVNPPAHRLSSWCNVRGSWIGAGGHRGSRARSMVR